ncbi:S8 family serine peptidase [Pontibacter akesuensis]|uniref:Por secretion system C-terminal sorting domain-containing protein n=1 Tax=Pontibacter akesuensis TaxID=388950 RepID=A0A1I7GWD3_9BACT|nr:S8 family serine peptidase [Pontibacter akesuensis]GHA54768.1 hypothetical protein GCM10007389_02610 [Pontibacter akesuensis]SFU52732.1 Por secretion system C-terminal sorting domain-containing protein [Pontibacter akesuensis]
MFLLPLLLKRSVYFAAFFLLLTPMLQAQEFGNKTVPHKVVYKLKQAQLQSALPANALSMTQAHQLIGAEKVRQKFPHATGVRVPENARLKKPTVDLTLIYELSYNAAFSFEEVQTALLRTGQVDYVEPLYIREPLHQPNDPASDSTKTTQFYLKQVQAYGGWTVEKGDTTMVIGVLDTGFRLTHRDLQAKVKHTYSDPIDGIDNDGDGFIDNFTGWDFGDDDNNVSFADKANGSAEHGTAVAGVAAAATNNGSGMAGMGYNALYMPLKVFSSNPGGSFGGYEAIVYAADKGCKVINISWGGTGSSKYEQDIINYAVLEKDALVVAAAGNTNAHVYIYPAAYDNVLSVGGASSTDLKYRTHTYNYNIDLISPSAGIYTTGINSDSAYFVVGGTSFAAPTVAGGAALVRTHFPELNARQVAERLRASTDNIYTLPGNKPYFEMLGTGRFNLKKALKLLNLKSVRCLTFAPRPKQRMAAGQSIVIDADFVNFLAPTSALQITLTSLSPYVSIEQGSLAPGQLGTMAGAATGERPFVIHISEDAPMNHTVYLRLGYADDGYADFQHFELLVNQGFATLTANNLHLSLNSEGNLGYDRNRKLGIGAKYRGRMPVLFESSLMLATEGGLVADNLQDSKKKYDQDFVPLQLARLHENTPLAEQEVRSLMQTNLTGFPKLEVKTVGYAWSSAPDQDYVIVEYQITNKSTDTIQELHAGLYADWNIYNYFKNAVVWNDSLQMSYAFSTIASYPYAAIKILTPEQQIFHATADDTAENDSTVLKDGSYTNAEKYKLIANGKRRLSAGGTTGADVAHVFGGTTLNVAPDQTKTIAFAILAGEDLKALKLHAEAAQQKYRSIKSGAAPAAATFNICAADTVEIVPAGGRNFHFYADAAGKNLLATGFRYTVAASAQSSTIYVANADSVLTSIAVPVEVQVEPAPKASFAAPYAQTNTALQLTDKSAYATAWEWDFGDGGTSTDQHPIHTFRKPGSYNVKLTVTDKLNCQRHTLTQTLQVFATAPNLYPNPVKDYLALALTEPLTPATTPVLTLRDVTGKVVAAPFSSADEFHVYYDLRALSPGVYHVHVTYLGTSYTRRVLVRR